MNFDDKEFEEETYISQDGFVTAEVVRGFTEISKLWDILTEFGGVICGGYVRYMCSPLVKPKKAGDVDVYFESEKSFNKVLEVLRTKYKVKIRHENEVSITMFKNKDTMGACPVIQLIKPRIEGEMRTTGTIEEVISNFDFTVVRCALISPEAALVDADFMHDEYDGTLRIKNVHCPIGSALRCMKYSRKGYFLPPSQAIKLFTDWEYRSLHWKVDMIDYMEMIEVGRPLTQDQVDNLEAMMRFD